MTFTFTSSILAWHIQKKDNNDHMIEPANQPVKCKSDSLRAALFKVTGLASTPCS